MTKKPNRKRAKPVAKRVKKKPSIAFASRAEELAANDPDQYNTERMFAAEHVVQGLLEEATTHNALVNAFTFEFAEGEEALGTCELNGVDDARDKAGDGGAWVSVKIYVPNLDINTEINR